MISERQLNANRRNAQHSTGPRTLEGRATVAQNALRHGLTAKTAVLPSEDPEEFRELRDALFEEYQPAGPTETLLVEQMVMSAWRLRRIRAIETGFFNLEMSRKSQDESASGIDPRARDFRSDLHAFDRLSRYEARIERSFFKAMHELQRLRTVTPDPPEVPENEAPQPADTNSSKQTQSVVAGHPARKSDPRPGPITPDVVAGGAPPERSSAPASVVKVLLKPRGPYVRCGTNDVRTNFR